MKIKPGNTTALLIILLTWEMMFLIGCKEDPVLPTLTTVAASGITISTATTGGNITSDGGAEINARGVCWSTSTQPLITGSHTSDSKGIGSFTSNLTGLTPNTSYFLRAYATNEVGTAYGSEVTFKTIPIVVPVMTTVEVTGITSSSAISGGNITADGGAEITARGICWAASVNPTTDNNKTTNGTGTGIFAASITGLTPGTSYHVRAYATNSAGTSYGNDRPFTTAAVTPTLTTTIVSLFTRTTAVSGGNITSDGGGAVTSRGVCWSTSANPSVAGPHTSDGTGNGTFVSNITGLTPNTDYYVRAYATNSAGTAYGNERTFKTSPILIPTISTNAVTSVELTTAISGGNITADNGGQVTERGVCWNTTGNPTTANPKTSDATGTGVFSSNLTGLATGTAYYVRAYATNSAGTAYGSQVRFSSSLSDIDGNIYRTVIIGNQLWMQSDLKTTKYTDNSNIPNVTDNTEWANAISPAYCWYNNQESYGNTYGIIYNWYTVETGILCPSGWSVPTDENYKTLELYLGMTQDEVNGSGWRGTDQGTQLKSTSLWVPPSGNGTNSSGFTALAGGYRYGADGSFNDIGVLAYWWSSSLHWFDATKGVYRRLNGDQTGVYREGVRKSGGKFVRCLKN